MLRIYYGDDRVKAQEAIRKELGGKYEVVEGEGLDYAGARDVFLGTSLFGARKIVVKGLAQNKEVFEKMGEFLGTEHEVILWEEKLDKRARIYKELQKAGVAMKEFKIGKKFDKSIFDILETAYGDGARAVKMLERIENENDPFMFVGLMASQVMKKYALRYGEKEKRVLKELSRLDMQMKGESVITSQWTLVKGFLLRVSSM